MILLTGGTGLVGSHVLLELMRKGRKVLAIRRAGSQTELVRRLFEWYEPEQGEDFFNRVEWVEGDVNDVLGLQEILQDVDQVCHCAAMVSFLPADRRTMMQVNVDGTANLANASLRAGIKKFCHTSSIAAVGKSERGEAVHEGLVWKTSAQHSWYAISKYGAEREVWRAAEEGLDVVIVNPSVVIGPGDPGRSSAQLYQSVKNGMKFYTSGVTGFVDVRDVAEAMVMLLESDISGERFILNSENLSYQTLFTYFATHAGVDPPRFRAGKFLSELAWRMEKTRSMITGQKPLITKETARNANMKKYFSGEKITRATGFRYRSIDEAARNTSLFFQKYPIYLSPDFRM
jgi:dihydroflavonol-4-reductase